MEVYVVYVQKTLDGEETKSAIIELEGKVKQFREEDIMEVVKYIAEEIEGVHPDDIVIMNWKFLKKKGFFFN